MKLKYSVNFRIEKRKTNGVTQTNDMPINLDFTYEGKRFTYYTGYRINAAQWVESSVDSTGEKVKVQQVKKNAVNKKGVPYNIINNRIKEIAQTIEDVYIKAKANNINVDNEYLRTALMRYLKEEKTTTKLNTIFWDKWDEYLAKVDVSANRRKQLKSTKNHLKNFESQFGKIDFVILNAKVLKSFEDYLLQDGRGNRQMIGEKIHKPKSQNTISGILKRLRTFLNWCMKSENGAVLKDNPFRKYVIKGEVYGAPICMTKEERDYLYDADIPVKRLANVRDIFCFQCFVGCRVGDLLSFTQDDIVNDTLIYYPNKTKENKIAAKVPLSSKAKAILAKYDLPGGMLLPYISEQKYNDYIKELFQLVGLNRIVTRLNPLTMKKEQLPLSQIATSHLARRTFISILHSKVKDSVIASMSGHVKGSKAFNRYYEIEDTERQEAIDKYLD